MPPTLIRLITPFPERAAHYQALLEGLRRETGPHEPWAKTLTRTVAALHESFDYFDWTGFYNARPGEMLELGPYLGGHGCLGIPFSRGVCGASARAKRTVLVPDVHQFPGHIACDTTTNAEIVVPVITPGDELLAVLDIDSDAPAAFNQIDQLGLEAIARWLGTVHRAEDAGAALQASGQ